MMTIEEKRAEFRNKINIDIVDNYDAMQFLQTLVDENIYFDLGADLDSVDFPEFIDEFTANLIGAQLQLIKENIGG